MSPNENGIGRPFAGEDRRSIIIRLGMEPGEVDRLDRLADKLNTTRSGAIREGLRRLEDQIEQEQENLDTAKVDDTTPTSSGRISQNDRDLIQSFLDECCIFESGHITQAKDFYAAFIPYVLRSGHIWTLRGGDFYRALRDALQARGLIYKRPGNRVTWHGVALKKVSLKK